MRVTHRPVEEVQTKKTECNPKYKCNFCDYSSESLDQICNHKLDKHTGQSVNFNNMDKVDNNNFLFKLLAEQNNDLLEEVLNMKIL